MARIGLLTTSCVLVVALGCQQSETPAPKVDPTHRVTRVSTEDSERPKSKRPETAEPDVKKPDTTQDTSQKDPKQEGKADEPSSQDQMSGSHVDHPFEPPFGERVELFLPPERGTVNVQRPITSVADAPEVQLKGFVKVGRQRAVLLIGKEVSFLAEGQKKNGIQVISIEPPLVTLQLGRNRWTVSLFEDQKE